MSALMKIEPPPHGGENHAHLQHGLLEGEEMIVEGDGVPMQAGDEIIEYETWEEHPTDEHAGEYVTEEHAEYVEEGEDGQYVQYAEYVDVDDSGTAAVAAVEYDFQPTFQSTSRRQPTIVDCEFCGVTLKHPSKIQAHMRTHTGEKPFECEVCGARFTQKTPLRMHMRRHMGDTPFECSFGCGRKFVSNALRNAHELKHKGVKRQGAPRPHLKPPRRRIAMMEQQQPLLINDHRSPIVDWQPPFGHIQQPISAAASRRIDEVIESVAAGRPLQPRGGGMRGAAGSKRAPIMAQCQFCGLMIKHPSKIIAHMRTHTGEKPFECGECGMRFATEHPLRIHIKRKHTGERPFECTWECGMRFVSLAMRNEHEKIVHAGIKRYECTAAGCRRMFTRRRYLMMHRQKEHPHLYAPPHYHDDASGGLDEAADLPYIHHGVGDGENFVGEMEEILVDPNGNRVVGMGDDDDYEEQEHHFMQGEFVEDAEELFAQHAAGVVEEKRVVMRGGRVGEADTHMHMQQTHSHSHRDRVLTYNPFAAIKQEILKEEPRFAADEGDGEEEREAEMDLMGLVDCGVGEVGAEEMVGEEGEEEEGQVEDEEHWQHEHVEMDLPENVIDEDQLWLHNGAI